MTQNSNLPASGAKSKSPPDLLDDLEDVIPKFELKGLGESTDESLELYKLLGGNTSLSKKGLATDVRLAELEQTLKLYPPAIDKSLRTAQAGHTFAGDGVELCDFIEKERPGTELIPFIKGMEKLAGKAADEAKKTKQDFRTIRAQLLEISQKISGQADHTAASEPLCDALTKLPPVIKSLEGHVSVFVNWWVRTEARLTAILEKALLLDARLVDKLRLRTVRNGWVDARNRYEDYMELVTRVQDSLPEEYRQNGTAQQDGQQTTQQGSVQPAGQQNVQQNAQQSAQQGGQTTKQGGQQVTRQGDAHPNTQQTTQQTTQQQQDGQQSAQQSAQQGGQQGTRQSENQTGRPGRQQTTQKGGQKK